MPSRNHITANALLGRNPKAWHDGSKTLTYSFLENVMPDYVKTRDTDHDGKTDFYLPLSTDRIRVGAGFSMTDTERDLTRQAVAAWNDVAHINLVEGTVQGGFGDITFGSAAFSDQDTFGFITRFPRPVSLGQADNRGDLWINSNNPDQAVNEIGHTSWNTYLHEMGHTLGLHHPNEDPENYDGLAHNNNRYTVMSYNPHPGERGVASEDQAWPLTPMLYDIQALQKLYGANTDTRAQNTVYFGDGTGQREQVWQYGADDMTLLGRHVILTIWDGGGRDLVDGSDLSMAVKIDLRPAHYSTIGGLNNNIAMAAAVRVEGRIVNWIENAWGSRFGDTLQGNAVNNFLRGGQGNDRLFGHLGRDILVGNKGADTLNGGGGNDKLVGGPGQDVFVFNAKSGKDAIADFTDDIDTIRLDHALWQGSLSKQQVIDTYADVVGHDIVFDFGQDRLTLKGMTDLAALHNDLQII